MFKVNLYHSTMQAKPASERRTWSVCVTIRLQKYKKISYCAVEYYEKTA